MTLEETILAAILFLMLVAAILYVVFGQVTIRKLRKNPETKDHLGVQFIGGWDILNVAQALSLPKVIIHRFEQSPLYFLEANTDILYKNTNWFDRWLARLFYWLFMSSGLSMVLLVTLSAIGIFD